MTEYRGHKSSDLRLLRACGLLLARPGVTLDELVDEVGVTRRTMFRYLNKIRDAGFVIEFRPAIGGYQCSIGSKFWRLQAELNDER